MRKRDLHAGEHYAYRQHAAGWTWILPGDLQVTVISLAAAPEHRKPRAIVQLVAPDSRALARHGAEPFPVVCEDLICPWDDHQAVLDGRREDHRDAQRRADQLGAAFTAAGLGTLRVRLPEWWEDSRPTCMLLNARQLAELVARARLLGAADAAYAAQVLSHPRGRGLATLLGRIWRQRVDLELGDLWRDGTTLTATYTLRETDIRALCRRAGVIGSGATPRSGAGSLIAARLG